MPATPDGNGCWERARRAGGGAAGSTTESGALDDGRLRPWEAAGGAEEAATDAGGRRPRRLGAAWGIGIPVPEPLGSTEGRAGGGGDPGGSGRATAAPAESWGRRHLGAGSRSRGGLLNANDRGDHIEQSRQLGAGTHSRGGLLNAGDRGDRIERSRQPGAGIPNRGKMHKIRACLQNNRRMMLLLLKNNLNLLVMSNNTLVSYSTRCRGGRDVGGSDVTTHGSSAGRGRTDVTRK